ncbi:uncharacterized protein PG986_001707 [Apiospora aurea]|uniref:DUF4048 domain-containing protein n=1 Tax=Apiospora aurea TaxID=335848 RepID=A0ABR1QXL6_9PEZI
MTSAQLRQTQLLDHAASLDAILATSSESSNMDDSTIPRGQATPPSGPALSTPAGQPDSLQDDKHSEFVLQPWSNSNAPASATSTTFDARPRRSSSMNSRTSNRLSLTLPIAPPTSMPSRPTPSSSVPQTPSGEAMTPGLVSPMDSEELIIAIAAQERRVLELREELNRAEGDLKQLKCKWRLSETYKVRPAVQKHEPLIQLATDGDDIPPARSSADIERKKAMLLGQGTPRNYRRKVMRGGHTRTLSLLSPTKSEHDIPIHHDNDVLRSPESYSFSKPSPVLNKRATWAPRQSPPMQPGMKQIAQDFKHGLWTFVEDLRQATVGDEGISATSNRTSGFGSRFNRTESDQDTIRASSASRGPMPFRDDFEPFEDTPSKSTSGSFNDRAQNRGTTSRPDPKPRKHFSWTPLTFDDVGDDDWSNWDSPNVRTTRWSGSTVSGDIIPSLPERNDENEATLRRKPSRAELRSPSPQNQAKLGELSELPGALLNSLNPSNIKRFSSDFIKEWEKSLSPPPETTTFEASFQQRIHEQTS